MISTAMYLYLNSSLVIHLICLMLNTPDKTTAKLILIVLLHNTLLFEKGIMGEVVK